MPNGTVVVDTILTSDNRFVTRNVKQLLALNTKTEIINVVSIKSN